MQHTQRRELITCVVFFVCMHRVFRFFDCVASRVFIALRVAYYNLVTACGPTKTDLNIGFQAAVRNTRWSYDADKKATMYAMHAHEKRNGRKHRIDCAHCVFCVHALCISFFWLRRKPCVRCVAYGNLETACRPMKTDIKVGFQAAVCNSLAPAASLSIQLVLATCHESIVASN